MYAEVDPTTIYRGMSDGKDNRAEVKMADRRGISRWVIAVTLLLLACCALCAPVQAGVSPDDGKYVGNNGVVIIGETKVFFFNESEQIIPYGTIRSTNPDIPVFISFNGPFDSSSSEYKIDLAKTDEYQVTGPNGRITVYFLPPELRAKTKVCGENFAWVKKGDNITLEANTNLWFITNLSRDFLIFKGPLPNNITYKLLDPSGLQVYVINDVTLRDIDVGFDYNGKNSITINTANLKTGIYRLLIETDPDTNNGLDAEGPEVSFEVRSKGVTMQVEPQEQATYEELVFSLLTTPHTNVSLKVTWGVDINVEFIKGKANVVRGGPTAFGTSDSNGEFKAVAYFAVSGTYEITATEYGCSVEVKPSTRENSTDSTEVKIVPFKAKLDVNKDPSIYHIGENVKITGSANTGDNITLKINDAVVATNLNVGGFDYTWPTKDKPPGSYRIAIWILPLSDPAHDPPDASISVVLIRGGLFAEPSAPFVALGDEFTIEGIVPGRDRVDIFTIAPKGGGGKGFFVEKGGVLDAVGLTYGAYGVNTDGDFETEKIKVSKEVDTGTYLIAALNYGRDGVWGRSQSSNLLEVISNNYATALGIKTTDQLLAILKDKTINAAGSDDLMGIATIRVEQGFVTVDDIVDVPLGSDITVTGTTNRQVDTAIIVTVESLEVNGTKLKPKIAKAKEDEKTFYNSFDVSFATESANIGTYQVTVDDADGHTASTTVRILPAEEHSVNVSTTPSPRTAMSETVPTEPTSTPSPTVTTPAPPSPAPEGAAKEPGFEALSALLALVALSFLLVRSRQRR